MQCECCSVKSDCNLLNGGPQGCAKNDTDYWARCGQYIKKLIALFGHLVVGDGQHNASRKLPCATKQRLKSTIESLNKNSMVVCWRERLVINLERFSSSSVLINDKISGRTVHKVVGLLENKGVRKYPRIPNKNEVFEGVVLWGYAVWKRLKIGWVQLNYWELYIPAYRIWTIDKGNYQPWN